MKARIVLIALAVACAHSEKAATDAPPAATVQQASGPAAQGTPTQPATPGSAATPPAPGAAPAVPGTAPSAEAAQTPGTPKSAEAPAGGTSTAVQAAKPSPAAEPAAPLMPEEEFRAAPPAAFASQPRFQAPKPVERKLKNGARVLVVTNHSVPLVAIDLRFLHGIDAESHDKPGLATFVADMVDEGTESRPSEKLSIEIEDLAAHISAGAGLET
ncbi:MAG TPA: hypothetical protein VH083_25500, partial [Myxococcales bacterium]|nr:hypothetical protein [Myxococcales bacterium]